MLKHKHHIIPRHAGGTNDLSNIIELTIPEHAEAHKKLWEENGNYKDKIAWLMLSGQLSHSEGILELQREAGKRTAELKLGICGQSKEQMIANGNKTFTMKVGVFNPVYAEKLKEHLKSGNARRGKLHSDETKQHLRSLRVGKKDTPEARENKRQAQLKRYAKAKKVA